MTDDQRVGAHRVERPRGVLKRLALLDRRLLDGEGDYRRAKPMRGGREAHQGARRIFVEQVEDDLAGELARTLSARAILLEPARTLVEDARDVVVAQLVDREDVHDGVA